MSFADDINVGSEPLGEDDVIMNDAGIADNRAAADTEEGQEDEEGEGKRLSDDSSVEEEEDEEEERKVRDGFIVDEDEDEQEEDEDEAEQQRRRKKRRKHRHRHRRREEEDEDLDEDDLELLEENTGGRIRARHLTRLRRGRDSDSPEPSGSRRKNVIESSDDDLDENNIIGAQTIQDIQNIWDDDRAGGRDDDDEGDLDDFIDDEDEEEGGAGAMAEEEREERRREKRRLERERRKLLKSKPELTGIDANAWDEIHDVFGDGHDYDWALVDDEEEFMEESLKNDMKYHDVFEPSVIKARLLTEDDDLIRAQDVPERMQLATSTLSENATVTFPDPLTSEQCSDAASWVTPRLGRLKERDFFRADGISHYLLGDLVQAVTRVLEYLFIQFLEVPYIFTHRRDYLWSFNPRDLAARQELLSLEDLWRIYNLGQKYRSLIQRRNGLHAIYQKLNVRDEYYEDRLKDRIETVEGVADVSQWLAMKYKTKKRDALAVGHDEEERDADKKHKLPNRTSAYDVAKRTIVSQLADAFGIKAHEVVLNFVASGQNQHFVEDQDLPPATFAEQFADPDPAKASSAEELLRQARMILATELGADPLLRQYVRDQYKMHAQISCLPTERGKMKIDKYHPYQDFKYLLNKPIVNMLESSQALSIFSAESEHLVTVSIFLPIDVKQDLIHRLTESFSSDSFSDAAKAWNDERTLVVQEAVEKHLLPAGEKWIREYMREEIEDYLAKRCTETFYERLDVAPYAPPQRKEASQVRNIYGDAEFLDGNLDDGQFSSFLAVSWGKGDPKKDEIHIVFLDNEGRCREHVQLDNLSDEENVGQFRELVMRRDPDAVIVGGFTFQTTKLVTLLQNTLRAKVTQKNTDEEIKWDGLQGYYAFSDKNSERVYEQDEEKKRTLYTPVKPISYIQDEVARIYQHSKRASEEFGHLPLTARYCVGLARYAQSPLNEYAALGPDITAITVSDQSQHLVPKEKLLVALERSLVDCVNKVGVDINRAVNDPYYAHLLPYVAGLGPRKAQALIKKIGRLGGHLVNREQFIKSGVLTTRIFLNAAGFLRIEQDPDFKEITRRNGREDFSNAPDPLDDTRIHPEDYELARKMATDALELDEEDVHDEHPSHVVGVLMADDDNMRKLDELNLDEFAVSMYESNQDIKRHTLNLIRAELLRPFGEVRKKFILPNSWEIVTMLTGETTKTLKDGVVLTCLVLRATKESILVKLDCGLEGFVRPQYYSDTEQYDYKNVAKGQTLIGVVISVAMDVEKEKFNVELSTRKTDIALSDKSFRKVKNDDNWNHQQDARDSEFLQRKMRAEVQKARRVIKHPNFQNFNSSQAEAFLEKQHAGDLVVRPSSKGAHHLAVTWKVADNLYQHVDVLDVNPDPTQGVGSQLIVDQRYEFSDLDELIVNHVKAMSRRVEELMAHEKFKKDDNELEKFLIDFVKANPAKSIYGFSLNKRKPGHFNLSFLAKRGSTIQTWPVRVAPEAYYLFDAPAAGVSELCDAFKVRHLHESQNTTAAGNKTPYGAGRMTPARTPGYMTPGHASVRHANRTPNPYSAPIPAVGMAALVPTPASYGGSTSGYAPSTAYAATPSTIVGGANGWQTPSYGMPPPGAGPPPGMHPGRAQMIQEQAAGASNGWTPGGGGRW